MDKTWTTVLLLGGGLVLLSAAAAASAAAVSALRPKPVSPNPKVTRWDDYIYRAVDITGVQPAVIAATIQIESSGYSGTTGAADEIGLMQIKCDTAKMMGFKGDCARLFNPDLNVLYGAKYLKHQLQRYDGNLAKMFSAYNAGTYTKANKTYVGRAMRAYQQYQNYYI